MIGASVLALLVGVVIAAQTLYAGFHRGPPAGIRDVARDGRAAVLSLQIVVKQAVIGGLLGYAIGIAIVLTLVHLGRDSSAAPQMPLWLAAFVGAVIVAMCVVASMVSLNKVTSIDPVKVFRDHEPIVAARGVTQTLAPGRPRSPPCALSTSRSDWAKCCC